MTEQTNTVQVTAEDIEAWSKVDRAIVDRARILCRKSCDPDCRACGAGRDAGWRRDAISAIKADAEAHRLASTPSDTQVGEFRNNDGEVQTTEELIEHFQAWLDPYWKRAFDHILATLRTAADPKPAGAQEVDDEHPVLAALSALRVPDKANTKRDSRERLAWSVCDAVVLHCYEVARDALQDLPQPTEEVK